MTYFTVIDEVFPELSLARVSTLGPSGTSSERAAKHFLKFTRAKNGKILLFPSYQEAANSVISGKSEYLLVANAFHEINDFYMHPSLGVYSVFHLLTPLYGLAKRQGECLPELLDIVSHPAPVPLISELLPCGYQCAKIIPSNSTAAAAAAVEKGEYNAALTTQPAAEKYNLVFFSNQRPIEMVWTVFIHQ